MGGPRSRHAVEQPGGRWWFCQSQEGHWPRLRKIAGGRDAAWGHGQGCPCLGNVCFNGDIWMSDLDLCGKEISCVFQPMLNLELASKEMVNLPPKYDLPWHVVPPFRGIWWLSAWEVEIARLQLTSTRTRTILHALWTRRWYSQSSRAARVKPSSCAPAKPHLPSHEANQPGAEW